MINTIKNRISGLYIQHSYILESKQILACDKKIFKKIMKGTKDRALLINSLGNLARHLNTYFSVNSVILIDEYDWPMDHAGDFYREANSFFRSMYSSVAKVSYSWVICT